MNFLSLKTQQNPKRYSGFTLLEILVVIGILGVLGTILITGFKNFQTRQTLELSTKEIRQMFETARSKTLASEGDVAYGVFIDTDAVTLFKGASYSSSDSNNSIFRLDPRVTISSVSFTPTSNEILFTRGTGEPSSSGSVEISLKSNPQTKRTITLTGTGIINSNE